MHWACHFLPLNKKNLITFTFDKNAITDSFQISNINSKANHSESKLQAYYSTKSTELVKPK